MMGQARQPPSLVLIGLSCQEPMISSIQYPHRSVLTQTSTGTAHSRSCQAHSTADSSTHRATHRPTDSDLHFTADPAPPRCPDPGDCSPGVWGGEPGSRAHSLLPGWDSIGITGGFGGGSNSEPARADVTYQEPAAPQSAYQQQQTQYTPCQYEMKQFLECAQNQSDLKLCEGFSEVLKQCRFANGLP